MKIAIVTGASSGLGREFLNQILAQSVDCDQIWAIARSGDKLAQLTQALGAKVVAVPLDLTDRQALADFAARLQEASPHITALINNAGVGVLGNFADSPTAAQINMLDLNVTALTAMTSLCLPYMQKGGFLLNVCSIAAFVPTPRMTVYAATKSYVYAFSKAMGEELAPKGITVCAVCPGPMATPFLDTAGITGQSKAFETLPYDNAEKVAKAAVRAALRGRRVVTPHPLYKFYRLLGKQIPHRILMKISKT